MLMTGPVYPAPSSLYVSIPEIEPKAEFGYLQTPVLNFILERLSSKGYNAYIAEGREVSGDLLKSRFYFERTGRVQIELSLIELKNGQEVAKVKESAAFEDFWVKLEGVLTSLRGEVPLNQIAPPPQEKPQEKPKEVIPPVKESILESSKRSQKSYEEKESLLSRLNPFKAISKVLPRKEEPLRIKVSVPPPPPPPYSSERQGYQNTFHDRSSLPQRISPQAPSSPQPQAQPVTQPQAQPASPWQWF